MQRIYEVSFEHLTKPVCSDPWGSLAIFIRLGLHCAFFFTTQNEWLIQ
jgi:hypothetical protein